MKKENHTIDKYSIIKFLKENKTYLQQKYKIKKIGLFGSYAKNQQTQESDIDLIVDMPSSFDDYYDLKEFLEEKFNKKIDLGLVHTIREHLKPIISKEVIYV